MTIGGFFTVVFEVLAVVGILAFVFRDKIKEMMKK